MSIDEIEDDFRERIAALIGPTMNFGLERHIAARRSALWVRCKLCREVYESVVEDDDLKTGVAARSIWEALKAAEEHSGECLGRSVP